MLYQVTIPILGKLQAQASANGFAVIDNLGLFISQIVDIVLIIAGILVFFYLAWGGLNWIMSSGDKAKVEEARDRITQAIIGLGIVAASWAVFLLLNYFFGLNLVKAPAPGPRTCAAVGESCLSLPCCNGAICDTPTRTCPAP
jgi:hypothetical protein